VYPDYLTGLFSAFGVMVALRHRDATGEGQWIDAALYESAFRIMEYTPTLYGRQGMVRERGGRQHVAWPGGQCQTRDGRWVAFTAPAQHLFERLCAMVGQPDLPRDPRYAAVDKRTQHMPEFVRQVEAWFAVRTFAEAAKELDSHQVPYSLIMSMADIFADAHYRVRQMIIDVPEPTVGALPQPGVVPKLSRTPGHVTHAGPAIGAHTDEILGGLLGMSAADIAQLRQEGVV
jgi:crotonobetainyl-CoA:carnitine CoA-transferase CaiB-like acyl-CoA transferase